MCRGAVCVAVHCVKPPPPEWRASLPLRAHEDTCCLLLTAPPPPPPRILWRALPERPAAAYWLPWPMSRITPASRAAASFANWSCASCSQTATPPSARAWSSTCSRSGSGSGLGLGFGLGFGFGVGIGVWVNVSGPPPARGPRRRRTASPRPCPAAAVR